MATLHPPLEREGEARAAHPNFNKGSQFRRLSGWAMIIAQ